MTPAELLQQARAAEKLSALDRRFGAAVARWSDASLEDASLIEFAAAVVSCQLARQQVFVDLERLADEDPLALGDAALYPSAASLTAALRGSRVVQSAGGPVAGGAADGVSAVKPSAPLILHGSRLYLASQFDMEMHLATALQTLASADPDDSQRVFHSELLSKLLRDIFPDEPGQLVNWQRIGAGIALSRGLAVITGGPGTGKTTTVTRLLAVLLHVNPDLRVALAAPTGKAATRLAEAVQVSKTQLRQELARRERDIPLDGLLTEVTLNRVPDRASTVHRLLGYFPVSNEFRFSAARPLPFDLVVIDEASMLDMRLACALLAALPAGARLILLGDKDQLSSVDAGMVLGDLCAGLAGHYEKARFSIAMAERLAELTGYDLSPLTASNVPPLADSICWLRVSRRFSADSGIGRVAEAVNAGDVEAALAEHGNEVIIARDGDAPLVEHAVNALRPLLTLAQGGADPTVLLTALNTFRVLAAVREGRDGVLALNARIERALDAAGLIDASTAYYVGRPLLITVNDHRQGLYNGDVGIVVRTPDGLRIALPDVDAVTPHEIRDEKRDEIEDEIRTGVGSAQRVRLLHPQRLPAHETVFAMTVHKSQGSEFDEVALVLPRAPSVNERSILTRELLYTAITRARARVRIYAEDQVLRAAIATPTRRASGLRQSLWGSSGDR